MTQKAPRWRPRVPAPSDEIRDWLSYDPETGEFHWLRDRRNGDVRAGDLVTTKNSKGYIRLSFQGKQYLAHRLAIWFVTGEMPEINTDHINGIRDDNRYCNLRCADYQQNNVNRTRPRKTPYRGVAPQGEKWRSIIKVDRHARHLGTFDTAEQAHAAYCRAATEAWGEFARFD